jgi:outer membrane protein OmpA-like peptidoglycan-associated protein
MALLLFSNLPDISAEKLAGPVLPYGGKLTFVERSDLSRYENGKYIGLENREVRGILDWAGGPEGDRVEGTFYVIGELEHLGAPVALKVDAAFPAAWIIGKDGAFDVGPDSPYPIVRGFPLVPVRELAVGDTWQAPGERMVEPLRDGIFTRVPIFCSYRYDGEKTVDGKPFHVITAKYALRYKNGAGPASDERLESVSGSHTVSIRISADSDELAFMSDSVEETYQLADSKTVTYKGFILTWFSASAPMDRAGTSEGIAANLERARAAGVAVEQTREGVSITISDIHFVADQAAVLPEDLPRLGAVAEALKQILKRSFLVIGHTAAVGTPESQQELSVQRAKAIVDFLISQGIDPKRLLYEGRGGTEPVAPNDTEQNMARNRRVQIVILED